MAEQKLETQYKERLMRQARLHFFGDHSDFNHLSVEEFETWKGARGLAQADQIRWFQRRKELNIISEILLEAYKNGQLALDGKSSLLKVVHEICNHKDSTLFGGIIWKALNLKPRKRKGRSSHAKGLRKHIRSLMAFFKSEYPNKTYNERVEMITKRFHDLGLRNIIQTDGTTRELLRGTRKKKKDSKKSKR